jgi:class 3 adenylate cyclase
VSLFRRAGRRTRRLLSYLRKRERTVSAERPALDRLSHTELFGRRAIVFTDTADFTRRTARDGILHFLMVFDRVVKEAGKVVTRTGGEIVKVDADSLLLRYPDVRSAVRGVEKVEGLLKKMNRKLPENERVHFSYGIGWGDVLDVDDDVFGLEVNLASKLGEDMARPGEVLLTPSAAAALDAKTIRRVVSHRVVTFEGRAVPIQRLRLRRGA